MFKLGINEPFPFGPPQSDLTASLAESPLMLIYTSDQVTEHDEGLFSNGKVKLSMCPLDQMLALLIKIEGFCEWSDTFYHPCMDMREVQPQTIRAKAGEYVPVSLVLVDRGSGLVKGLRMVTVTYPFANRLATAVETLNEKAMDVATYQAAAHAVMNRFTVSALVRKSQHVERAGVTI